MVASKLNKAIVEIMVEGSSELALWALLLPIFCAAAHKNLKEAAAGLSRLCPSLDYSRVRKICSFAGSTKVRPLSHEEFIAIKQYFPQVKFLEIQGTLARIEIERRD